jgi:hypothetical protein
MKRLIVIFILALMLAAGAAWARKWVPIDDMILPVGSATTSYILFGSDSLTFGSDKLYF